MAMVSLGRERGLDLSTVAKPSLIITTVVKLHMMPEPNNVAVGFERLSPDEVRTLIDCAIKIEQARTGDVLSPTEYRNRFAGLDMSAAGLEFD